MEGEGLSRARTECSCLPAVPAAVRSMPSASIFQVPCSVASFGEVCPAQQMSALVSVALNVGFHCV